MTGQVTISYSWDGNQCVAHLEWKRTQEQVGSIARYAEDRSVELSCKHSTFEQARAGVIEAFKKLPPSESIVIEEES